MSFGTAVFLNKNDFNGEIYTSNYLRNIKIDLNPSENNKKGHRSSVVTH